MNEILFFGARNSIGYLNYAFNEGNLNSEEIIIIQSEIKIF